MTEATAWGVQHLTVRGWEFLIDEVTAYSRPLFFSDRWRAEFLARELDKTYGEPHRAVQFDRWQGMA